jgi:hypothetical protein
VPLFLLKRMPMPAQQGRQQLVCAGSCRVDRSARQRPQGLQQHTADGSSRALHLLKQQTTVRA